MGSKNKFTQLILAITVIACFAIAVVAVHAQQAAPAQGAPQAAPAGGGQGFGAPGQAPGAPGAAGAAAPGGRGAGLGGGRGGTRPTGNFSTQQIVPAWPWDVTAMEDALPAKGYATPKQPRKILVLCKASGFVHSSIPLAAQTLKELGDKTGAWSTTITYDPADITAENLKQYDLVFLDSTTGQFLDDPSSEEITSERRQALLNFVQNGKGLAGIHAAVDSYHTNGGGGGRGRGRGAAAGAPGAPGAPGAAPAETAPAPAPAAPAMAAAAPEGAIGPQGTWPDFNHMVGGFFKFHWTYPQLITVKIDDPKSPLTQMFHGQEFTIHDETYTLLQDSNSSWKNVHVLTSIDYDKMSDADKAKEPATTRRTDGDYALSYIRREGKGRVFMELHGHDEHIYQMPDMLQHILAGTQYALGDLKADDAPTMK